MGAGRDLGRYSRRKRRPASDVRSENKAPSGFEIVMNTNHHLSKPAMIGKINFAGTFDVVWRFISPIKASVWSR